MTLLAPLRGGLGPLGQASGRVAYRDLVLADSPRLYWRLGEAAGSFADLGALGVTGALTGTGGTRAVASLLTGDADPALQLPGSSAYVAGSGNLGLSGNLTASVEFWAKIAATSPDMCFVSFGGSGGGLGFGVMVNVRAAGRISLEVGGNLPAYSASAASNLAAGTRSHVVVVKTPGGINTTTTIYVDSVAYAATSGVTTVPNITNSPPYVGQFLAASGSFLSGVIDEVAIYNYALTAAQVLAHYQKGAGL